MLFVCTVETGSQETLEGRPHPECTLRVCDLTSWHRDHSEHLRIYLVVVTIGQVYLINNLKMT